MDKKNVLIGLAFILAAFGLMFYQSSQMPPPGEPARPAPAEAGEPADPARSGDRPADGERDVFGTADAPEPAPRADEDGESVFRPVEDPGEVDAPSADEGTEAEEVIRTLANDFIEVEFTTRGGGIRRIHFLQTKKGGRDTFVFNAGSDLPALGLGFQGPESAASFGRTYEIVEAATSPTTITFERALGGDIVVRRTFSITAPEDTQGDPYLIGHETSFLNRSDQALQSGSGAHLHLGTVHSIGADKRGEFLNFGYFDGEDAEFIGIRKFTGSSGFLGIGASAPVDEVSEIVPRLYWGTVKNQFFAFVANIREGLRSDGFFVTGTTVEPPLPPDAAPADGIRASLAFPIDRIEPGGSQEIRVDFYAGPKEFRRLARLGDGVDEVMQFGFFGFFSKILLFFLYGVHSFVPTWGWSIVVMTIIIKLLFWPLTAKAAQSQKRMQKIQAPLKELREKYKDNPQKMQKETMKLFRENKVNPAAGCLPILIQMPIFIGLFWMLRTASELRYAPFLWIDDLSRPDTVAEVFGFPVNILPLIMGATMFFQMRMTPAMASADAMQQKIFKLLPFVFLVFLYNFSSGLVLYWTVQNLLTILQQYITNKRDDVANEPVVVPAAPKKKARRKK
ncbi:MAG: YidC/Oxa1 family insertase periplasmic-domain containing protein [Puniceicoccaceae bacterium]